MSKRKVDLPLQTRGPADGDGVCIRADSVNEDARTVDVIWSKGARVSRRGYLPDGSGFGRYDEELSLDPGSVDLTRMNNGAPLLNAHAQWSLGAVLGVVVDGSAKVQNGEGVATVRFSEREDVEPVFQDVKGGILRNVSVGYSVQEYEVTREEGKVPVFRATRWTPMEVSAVPVGADDQAGFRSADETNPCKITEKGDTAMKPKVKKQAAGAVETRDAPENQPEVEVVTTRDAPAPEVDETAIRAEVANATRLECLEIRSAAAALGLDDSVADDLIKRGVSIDEARKIMIDKKAEQSEGVEIRGGRIEQGVSGDDPAVIVERMAEAVAVRYNGQEPSEAAREYVGVPMSELGRDLLEARGEKGIRRIRVPELIQRALGTSDFPNLLQGVGNRILLPSYQMAPATYTAIARKTTAADFRTKQLLRDGDFPELLPVNEHGELKHGSMGEGKETIQLKTVGRRLRLTREALINDDLGAFADMATKSGQAARRYENKTVWGVVINNTATADGKALFHADHKNLAAAGAAISATSVGKGKAAIRKQKNADKNTLNYAPSVIVVGSDFETVLEQYLASVVIPTKSSDVVPDSHKRLTPVVEPLLDKDSGAVPWYMFVDPAQLAAIMYAYLEGMEGPQLAQRELTTMMGAEYEVVLDFAAAPSEHRATYKNPGVAP